MIIKYQLPYYTEVVLIQPDSRNYLTIMAYLCLILHLVPLGTVFKMDNEIIADLYKQDESFIACRGGLGGNGNASFVTASNRLPREATDGTPGEEKRLEAEMQTIADVGLVNLTRNELANF